MIKSHKAADYRVLRCLIAIEIRIAIEAEDSRQDFDNDLDLEPVG